MPDKVQSFPYHGENDQRIKNISRRHNTRCSLLFGENLTKNGYKELLELRKYFLGVVFLPDNDDMTLIDSYKRIKDKLLKKTSGKHILVVVVHQIPINANVCVRFCETYNKTINRIKSTPVT